MDLARLLPELPYSLSWRPTPTTCTTGSSSGIILLGIPWSGLTMP